MIIKRNKFFSEKEESSSQRGGKKLKEGLKRLIEKGKEVQKEKMKNPKFGNNGVDPEEAARIHQLHNDIHQQHVQLHTGMFSKS